MVDKDKFLDIMFNGDYINKLTDEDIDKLVDKVVDTIEVENGKKTKMDIINTMVEELYEDKKKKEDNVFRYYIIIGTMGEEYKTTLCVSFSGDFDEFENFIYDKLCNEKFIGFKICDDKGKEYSRFFKCSEIVEISIERAE